MFHTFKILEKKSNLIVVKKIPNLGTLGKEWREFHKVKSHVDAQRWRDAVYTPGKIEM